MTSVPHESSGALPKRRRLLSQVLVREMWASLAISVMWLAVLFDALFGPNRQVLRGFESHPRRPARPDHGMDRQAILLIFTGVPVVVTTARFWRDGAAPKTTLVASAVMLLILAAVSLAWPSAVAAAGSTVSSSSRSGSIRRAPAIRAR